jgi:hypothetical protein
MDRKEKRTNVELVGTVTWQTDLIDALHARTTAGEATYFYEIGKLFRGYSPKGRISEGPPAFILSSSPLTEKEQIQTIDEYDHEYGGDLIEKILGSTKLNIGNEELKKVRKQFIDAGVTLDQAAGA